MVFDPAALTFDTASKYLPTRSAGVDFEKDLFDLIEAADFWQAGRRYLGPMPAPGAGFGAGVATLKKSFAPILKCREVLRRHVRGVCGREPAFELAFDGTLNRRERRRLAKQKQDSQTQGDSRTAFADDADAAQGAWWDERGGHEVILRFTQRLRAVGAAYLRYDVPPGLLTEGSDRATGELAMGVDASEWKGALGSIYFEVCARGSASIHTDPATMQKTAFYAYSEQSERGEKIKCVQISWLETRDNDTPLTRVKVVREFGETQEWTCDTGGHLLVIQAAMDALLTPDLLRLQDIMSSIATMMKLNSDVAGFPEKTALDVAPPEKLVADPDNPGQFLRQATALPSGARSMQFLYSYADVDGEGKPLTDDNGRPVIRSGTMHYREPVSSQPLRDDIDYFETQLYRAVNQGHVAARKSANASAAMLVEDRADYAASLLETKPHVEKALRELLHAMFCLSAFLAGDSASLGVFKEGRVSVTCHVNAGPLSIEERNEIQARQKAGLLSRESAMVMLGSEDVDAEIDKLDEDEERINGETSVALP